jgi:hypothetical protein
VKTQHAKKARSKTERNPSSFDLGTLNVQQKKLHESITASWNEVCTQHASLGGTLREMHDTFKKNGTVKAGGPGSRWTRYLAAVGIPKSTAKDYMDLAKKRNAAGIPASAEKHLASIGVPLDKPKVVDALLTPELRQKVADIKSAKDAEALKPRIMEISQTPQRKLEDNKPLGADAASTIDKSKAIVAAIHYLARYEGKAFRAKFAEFWRELRNELWEKATPAGAKKPAATATLESLPESAEVA